MQKGTRNPEQVAVHPSDPAGRYYTVTFAVLASRSVGKNGAVLFGTSSKTVVQRAGYASPFSYWLEMIFFKALGIGLLWFDQ